jgi:esterase/lipase superfamily enzyme
VLLLVVLAGCDPGRSLMPTPNLYLDPEIDPFADVPPALQGNAIDLLYVTDREPIDDSRRDWPYLRHGYGRSYSMAFGSCIVELGNVTWEDLVKLSRTRTRKQRLPLRVVSVEERARFPATPLPVERDADSEDYGEYEPVPRAAYDAVAQRLRARITRRLALSPRKEAFVFVHGFNNQFEDAAFTAAELWHFLGREGVPIVYSWPAGRGGLRGYSYDTESGKFTLFHLKEFLRILASCPALERIHVIAHSRGTDVAGSAIRELVIEARLRQHHPQAFTKLGNIVFAAPDIDTDVLTQRYGAERLFVGYEQLTIYVSPGDKALGLSKWLNRSLRRLGLMRPDDFASLPDQVPRRGTTSHVVDVTVPTGFIGHSYLHANQAVSSDLILLLREDRPPGAAHGRPLEPVMRNYWRIDRKDYPAVEPERPSTPTGTTP